LVVLASVASAKINKAQQNAALVANMADGEEKAAQVAFDYSQQGANWPDVCASGQRQSPIALTRANLTCKTNGHERKGHELAISYRYPRVVSGTPTNVTLRNNGYTVVLEGDLGYAYSGTCHCDTLSDTQRYVFKSVEFHAPSQHTWEGLHYPLEAHVVHQKVGAVGNNDMLIVSVPFDIKRTPGGNKFLQIIGWDNLPNTQGNTYVIPSNRYVDLKYLEYSLVGDYWAYDGSLTTPGCDETVTWRVMERPLGASQAQVDAFKALFTGGNTRAIQALNGRELDYFEV